MSAHPAFQNRPLQIEQLEPRQVHAIAFGITPYPGIGLEIEAISQDLLQGELVSYARGPDGSPTQVRTALFADGTPTEIPVEFTLSTPDGFTVGSVVDGEGDLMVGNVVNEEKQLTVAVLWTSPTDFTTPFGTTEPSQFVALTSAPYPVALAAVSGGSTLLASGVQIDLPPGFVGRSMLEPKPGESKLFISGELSGKAAIVTYDLVTAELTPTLIDQSGGGITGSAIELSRMPDGSETPTAIVRSSSDQGVEISIWNLADDSLVSAIGTADIGSIQSSYGVTTFSQNGTHMLHVVGGHEAKLLGVPRETIVPVEQLLLGSGFDLNAIGATISRITDIDATQMAQVNAAIELHVDGLPVSVLLHAKDPSPFQNPDPRPGGHLDINGDGYIAPLDALIIINRMNASGPGVLGRGERVPGPELGPDGALVFNVYIDPTGDGFLAPLDALTIINHLNAAGPGQLPPPEATVPDDDELTAGPQGEARAEAYWALFASIEDTQRAHKERSAAVDAAISEWE